MSTCFRREAGAAGKDTRGSLADLFSWYREKFGGAPWTIEFGGRSQ